VKRKWIIPSLCVLVMIFASSGVSAVGHNFGTATANLTTNGAVANAPQINDWWYYIEVEGAAFLNVTIDCEFRDQANGDKEFSFNFELEIELWTWVVWHPVWEFLSDTGFDNWGVVNNQSALWLNDPHVYSETLDVEIVWYEPHPEWQYWRYKCILDVYIENHDEDVIDTDQEIWWIDMDINDW